MPRILHFDSEKEFKEFPRRNQLLRDWVRADPSDKEEILFHGFDIANLTKKYVYGCELRKYSLIVTGILTNGERSNLIIDNIRLYFDVRLKAVDNYTEISRIKTTAYGNGSSPDDSDNDIIWRYPGYGFSEKKVPYLRLYFNNIWTRKNALKNIGSSKDKYSTANDLTGNLIGFHIIQNEWTLGDWSLVRNFDYSYDKKKQIHNLFISDPEDFIAVNRPLSAEKAITTTPKIPIYFHIPYDIEVNGCSDALPTVNNMNEKIFMLSCGIYRSDQPSEPVVSFTISHMKCMEEHYEEYMKSERRTEFMENDKPDWWLILTDSEEDTLLCFAEILGRVQPEFRSQFNGYSFDDPFIGYRIKQHEKYMEFVERMSIVPYFYTAYGTEGKTKIEDVFKYSLLDTHIKLEAGVFDKGDNRRRIHYVGSINVDIMCAMKKANPKDDLLAGHALRAYLDRYGLPKKIDMSIADMNKYYKEEDGIGMLLSADYCTVDSLSCHRIANKISLLDAYLALAHLSLCTPSDSAIRAGGMKVKNTIYCFGKRMDINYSEYFERPLVDKYPGAVVFAPVRGRYTEVPTIALDFSSLYPSIMRALWISSETFIDVDKKPKLTKRLKEEGYDLYEFHAKWEYDRKDEETEKVEEIKINKNVAYVRKHPDGSDFRGVYPKLLELLTNIRKLYKKSMAKASDNVARLQTEIEADPYNKDHKQELFEANLDEKSLNQKQLAVKVISNTIYGCTGSTRFALYNPYIAGTITLTGQKLITAASDVATEMGFKRLYGDSFTGSTPVILREDGEIWISRVDEILDDDDWDDWGNLVYRGDAKQQIGFSNLEIWEKDRFVKVNHIIRHKTDKEIVRVNTHCGLADVTIDHSLFKSDGEKISPDNIVVTSGLKKDNTYVEGTELLTTSFNNLIQEFKDNEKDSGISEDLAWCYGFWMAEGSARYYNYDYHYSYDYKKNANCKHIYRWYLDNKVKSILERCKDIFDFNTEILDTLESSGVYRLVVRGDVKTQCLKFSNMFYNEHREKIVPMEILYSSKEVAKAFLNGFYEGDGDVKHRNTRNYKYKCFAQKGQQVCLQLLLLIHKCGYDKVSINNTSLSNVFSLTFHNNPMKKPSNVVKKKTTLHESYNDYVYDFNTETGKHHAGIGNLIVSNTDSCFLLPTVEMMKGETLPAEKVKICQALAENELLPAILKEIRNITRRETNVVDMMLDKLLYPAIYLGKKRYAGIIYEGNKKPQDYISGLEFMKRGKSNLLIDLSKEVVRQVLDLDNNKTVLEMVLEVFQAGTERLQKESINYFIKKAKYKPGKQGSLTMFINRMKQKAIYDPVMYELPKPNTVFEYIVTAQSYDYLHKGTMRKLKISDKMEFKGVVEKLDHLKPDYFYYIEDVIGALARFICFHEEFNDSSIQDDDIDKKSNESAKKFLKEKLNEFMGINKIHHTIVKRQSKYVYAQHSKQYGEFIHVLSKAFDEDINPNNLTQYVIEICNHGADINVEDDTDYDKTAEEQKECIEYLNTKNGKITGIYSRYIEDLKKAADEELGDVTILSKSSHISRSTTKICETIRDLKYLNAILRQKPSNYGLPPPEDCNPCKIDPIIKLLLKKFGGNC